MDLGKRLERLHARHDQISAQLSSPELAADPRLFQQLSREHQRLGQILSCAADLTRCRTDLAQNRELLADPDFAELAKAEIPALEERLPELEEELKTLLVPPHPNDSRNCIVEIRPAAGGDEAALFAEELMRMYLTYAKSRGWRDTVLDYSPSDLGGLKSATFELKGIEVFKEMSFESGVHRVQRVPSTETQGRIHTSTVTVAVLPEAEEVDIQIDPKDLRFDTFRASGAGGQHVNKTDSAVRITHIPSGIAVSSQQERSQHQNREICMQLLRSRLLDEKLRAEEAKLSTERRSQIGSGDRSEKIRTYNFPQSRVTDHRFGITLHDLSAILKGDLGKLMRRMLALEADRRLALEAE